MPSQLSLFKTRKNFAVLCSGLTIAVAAMVLFGWAADIDVLKSISSGLPMMKPNTALAFILCGAGLYFASRQENYRTLCVSAFGLATFLIGSTIVIEHIGGYDFQIDRWLVQAAADGSRPGRMSPHSAISFTLLGASLVLTAVGFGKIAEGLVMIVRFIAIVALLGLLYGADKLYSVTHHSAMAVHTAALFLVITTGVSVANTGSTVSRLLASRRIGGSMGRRIIPVVFIIPPAIGVILQTGYEIGLYDASFRLALTIALSMVTLSLILFRFSQSLDEVDLQRRQTQADLAEKEARYRELFDYSQGLICIHDLEGNLTTVNKATLQMLGFHENEILGKNLRRLVSTEHQPMFEAYIRKVTNEGLASGLLELKSKSGSSVILRYNNVLATEEGREPYVLGHAQNVTELLAAQSELKNLSLTDELTGLYNRRGFITLAEQQLKLERHGGTARGLTLLFADMDGLKAINDNYGHEAGSEALATLAILIKSAIREADVVARWGGDEFVVLAIGAKGESPQMLVERIKDRIDDYNADSGKPYHVACSIGVAPVDVDGAATFDETIAAADAAMYAEKKRRKAGREETHTLAQSVPQTTERARVMN